MKMYFYLLCLSLVIVVEGRVEYVDERYVCAVKTTCVECLQLVQCNWCQSNKMCYSAELAPKDHCQNDTIAPNDFGLNLVINAQCACDSSAMEQFCRPPGVSDGAECSGRGTCQCGRCVCTKPDSEHPTKEVWGAYCELDNFSCDRPDCREGPYLFDQDFDEPLA